MRKKAVTLTEIMIAISILIVIILPIAVSFSNSGKALEKASNVSFAAGLSRYIIQNMMTMRSSEINNTPDAGISCVDPSDDNTYFKHLFYFKNKCDNFSRGLTTIRQKSCPRMFYNRICKYNFRYIIHTVELPGSAGQIKSATVNITWKEMGADKVYKSHAYIVFR